jgi:ferric-dicitrate binding protein FerR (iron transport regulator)
MNTGNIKISPQWSKSKDEIWNDMFGHFDEREDRKPFPRRIPYWSYAAVLFVLVLLTVTHLYTVNEEAGKGEHSVIRLPDNSSVTLNAESKISYKPFQWFISRKVTLEGEACFEVKSGSRFSVRSGRNRVNVLGTTFVVYARPEMYRVTCLTGRIEACAGQDMLVLHSGMQVTCRGQTQHVDNEIAPYSATGWMEGKFVFTETPLSEVVAEIERQYDIHVTSDSDLNRLYTGNFHKTEKPEDVLEIIGKPFGITFNIK